ncbi:MAG: amidohydrolase [Acidobacteria bacterium]|nr:amidohydrolase [Acidobacteriota bacterium]
MVDRVIVDSHLHPHDAAALRAYGEPYLRCAEIYQNVQVSHFNGDGRRPIPIQETARLLREAGATMGIVVNMGGTPLVPHELPNEALVEAVGEDRDILKVFAGVNPRKGKEAVRDLRYAFEKLGCIGVKIHPPYQEVFPNNRELMYPLYQVMVEHSAPVLFHTGNTILAGTKLKYGHPMDLDEVAVDFPDLKIIMAHWSWPWIDDALAVMSRHAHVYADVSGHLPKYLPAVIWHHMQRADLRKRFFFATDYPFIRTGELVKLYDQFEQWHCPMCNRVETWKPGVKEAFLGQNFLDMVNLGRKADQIHGVPATASRSPALKVT